LYLYFPFYKRLQIGGERGNFIKRYDSMSLTRLKHLSMEGVLIREKKQIAADFIICGCIRDIDHSCA
jgi:hypothetical protein